MSSDGEGEKVETAAPAAVAADAGNDAARLTNNTKDNQTSDYTSGSDSSGAEESDSYEFGNVDDADWELTRGGTRFA